MAKLEFTLKQHTPIIHFLPGQPGATLRATELKPKLDKFLIRHAFNNDFERYKTHLVGWRDVKRESDFDGKKAFDYKVKVGAVRSEKFAINAFPLFFGNMGQEQENYKEFVFSHKPFSIEFFSFNTGLLDLIQTHFPAFLFKTNFGTRQSKGFGAFYLSETDPAYTLFSSKFHFTIELPQDQGRPDTQRTYQDFKKIFTVIDVIYKSLRSGINDIGSHGPRFYFKPMMFVCAKQYGIQWDKRTIKKHYFSRELSSQIRSHGSSDILSYSSDDALMKEVLGLSSSETWKFPYNATITKENINYEKDQKIERFKSPITFKIIRQNHSGIYDVFILTDPINKKFLGKEFAVKKNGTGTLSMFTPDGFNIDGFLNFAFTKVDLDKHVKDKTHRDRWQFKAIKRIYGEIRQNLKAQKNHD